MVLTASIQLSENNFLGSGNRTALAVQSNSYSQKVSFSYLNPYITPTGISAGYNISYASFDTANNNTARYTQDTFNIDAIVGIPLSETTSVQGILGWDDTQLTTQVGGTPAPLIQYLKETLGNQPLFPCYIE